MCGGGACVGLDKLFKPSVKVEHVIQLEQPGLYEGRGYVYLKPQGIIEKSLHRFQSVIQAEKITQIANECFHLFHRVLRAYASSEIYEFFKNLHDGAHTLNEGLHAISIISDLLSLKAGKFVVREHRHGQAQEPVDYLRTAARICHFISHGLATTVFLARMKIISIGRWNDRLVVLGSSLTALGYTMYTCSLLWRRFYSDHHHEHHFASDLAIQGGGIFIEMIFCARELNLFAEGTELLLSQMRSAAMIIQSFCVLDRLSAPDRQAIKVVIDTQKAI